MIETLTAARDLIAEHGHGKEIFEDPTTNCLCTIGAVIKALGLDMCEYGDPRVGAVAKALTSTISTYGCTVVKEDPFFPNAAVYNWNDRPSTTQQDVIKLFNDTIELVSA